MKDKYAHMRDEKGRCIPGHKQPKTHPWKQHGLLATRKGKKLVGTEDGYKWVDKDGED
jgi:hypothetical protein